MDLIEKNPTAKRHPWEKARFKVIKDLLNTQIREVKGLNILDIGCGDLFFLDSLSEKFPGNLFYGVDTAFKNNDLRPSTDAVVKRHKSLDELPQDFKFDIVFLLDVIEHVEEDENFLQDLVQRPFVTEQTTFIITAPAFQSLFSSYDRFLKHYRRYTNETLENLTHKVGLRTLSLGYFFFSLLFVRYLEVTLEKGMTKNEPATGTRLSSWNRNDFLTFIIKSILILDFKVHMSLKKIGFSTSGLSNYLICKKRV